MATKHWVRDVLLSEVASDNELGNSPEMNTILFNFLRVAGWEWLWECDGEVTADSNRNPNHVSDGNMESAGVANWTVVAGGTRNKVTTPIVSGTQALRVVSSALGDGVRSDALLQVPALGGGSSGSGSMAGPNGRGEMTLTVTPSIFLSSDLGNYITISSSAQPNNNGTFLITAVLSATQIRLLNPIGVAEAYYAGPFPPPTYQILIVTHPKYELFFHARNGQPWDVEVDPGTGSFSVIGTIPASGGAYVQHHMNLYRQGAGSMYIRFVASAADTLYVDSLFAFHSFWEFNAGLWSGSDGIITNPDKFSTAGSYTLSADDVGWHVFVWDPTNNKNSGVYKITAVALGVATLDLRSGTAALTSASGLEWRLIHIQQSAPDGSDTEMRSGFSLQSPHATSWRLFVRQNLTFGASFKSTELWAAPEDTDYDVSTGAFYKTGFSTQRDRQSAYQYSTAGTITGMHLWFGSYPAAGFATRSWIMTDEDGSFVSFVHFDVTSGQHGAVLVGFLGADAYHPDEEEFALLSRWETHSSYSELDFDANAARFAYSGTTFAVDGLTRSCSAVCLGYSTAALYVEGQSNAGVNPWSSREWVRPLIILRDPSFTEGDPSIRNTDCGWFQTRTNMADLSTFDSNAYLHFDMGFCWEWSGEAII